MGNYKPGWYHNKKTGKKFYYDGGKSTYEKTTNEYMNDLIRNNTTKDDDDKTQQEKELKIVMDNILEEMENQELHNYDIKSNDTDEMMFFIDEAVTPIVNNSNLSEQKKKEIIGFMKMDVNDNKRWSIKTGVNTIRDWYKIK